MKEKYMRFGDYIKKKRQSDPRELTITDMSKIMGISRGHYCDIENQRKPPFDGEKMKLFANYLELSEEDTALLYDLASRDSRQVPYDLEDIFTHEPVGELARTALRLSKGMSEPEAIWKQLIRELEASKAKGEGSKGKGDD